MDDFNGHCGEGKYPLISTISKTLRPQDDVSRSVTYSRPEPKIASKAALMSASNNRRYFLPRDEPEHQVEYLDSPSINEPRDIVIPPPPQPSEMLKAQIPELREEIRSADKITTAPEYNFEYAFRGQPADGNIYSEGIPIVEKRVNVYESATGSNRKAEYSMIHQRQGRPHSIGLAPKPTPTSRRYTDGPLRSEVTPSTIIPSTGKYQAHKIHHTINISFMANFMFILQ